MSGRVNLKLKSRNDQQLGETKIRIPRLWARITIGTGRPWLQRSFKDSASCVPCLLTRPSLLVLVKVRLVEQRRDYVDENRPNQRKERPEYSVGDVDCRHVDRKR